MQLRHLLLLSLLVVSLKAASVDDLTFTLNDDGVSYSVTGCSEAATGELIIPSTYNGLPVTSIGDEAFFNCVSLTRVTIPESVIQIGRRIFDGASSLSVIIFFGDMPPIGYDVVYAGIPEYGMGWAVVYDPIGAVSADAIIYYAAGLAPYHGVSNGLWTYYGSGEFGEVMNQELPLTITNIPTRVLPRRFYVNANATAGGDGSSWQTAFNDLQDALAVTVSGRGDQVWIAEGTYYPIDINDPAEFDRTATFYIKDQVALYGGFTGNETDLVQRDWETHPTILSGEIWEDSFYWSLHVTTIDSNRVTFDGITITKSNSIGVGNAAAVYGSGYVTATNCTFSENSATYGGVASGSTWTATNCTFSGNSASQDGGVAHYGTWTATNCIFSGNSTGHYGAVANSGTWTATNCIFSGNSSDHYGGVAYSGTWTATNCTFSGNSAAAYGGLATYGTWKIFNNIFYNNAGYQTFYRSTIYATNETAPSPFTAIANNLIKGGGWRPVFDSCTLAIPEANLIDADPLFVNAADPDGPDDIWGTQDDGLRLQAGSPAIGVGVLDYLSVDTYDLDGDTDTVEPHPIDIAGYKRVQDATLDLGAYEYGNTVGISSFIITASATIGGTVSPSGAIVNTQPTEITLAATADNGYVFGHWTGDIPEEHELDNPLTLNVEEKGSITAEFLQDTTDTDADGLSQYQEVIVHGTDPADADSDDDGLSDGAEVTTHSTDPLDADSDEDGLLDGEEVNTYSTDPLNADSDDDGLTDAEEVNTYSTDPNSTDSDSDSLSDYDEIHTYSTEPNDTDSDDDSLFDSIEISLGTNPNSSDTDGDGISDAYESNTGTYASETDTGTDPLAADSSGDGLSDGFAVGGGFDPTVNYSYLLSGSIRLEEVRDLRPGSILIEVQNGQANLTLNLQESTDLNTWTDAAGASIQIPINAEEGTKFFRFALPE